MKIQELVEILNTCKNEYGNIDVYAMNENGEDHSIDRPGFLPSDKETFGRKPDRIILIPVNVEIEMQNG
jgi:hypothetical protein